MASTTDPLHEELMQQPHALRNLVAFYQSPEGRRRLAALPAAGQIVLTGMGASYHAAWIAAQHLGSLGLQAAAVEAVDLVYYLHRMLNPGQLLIYISQSGRSGEVGPALSAAPDGMPVVAITNDPASELARRATLALPLLAGEERLVAGKTYVNSLALLWLAARRLAGVASEQDVDTLSPVAGRLSALLDGSAGGAGAGGIAAEFKDAATWVFLGHGPHAATARQCAMMLAEWAKQPVLDYGIGAFRHGFVETAGPGMAALVFAAPGRTAASAQELASTLASRGAHVLVVENGRVAAAGQAPAGSGPAGDGPAGGGPAGRPLPDEFLSPLLDVVPLQLLAAALAQERLDEPGFRYISKVVGEI